MIRIIGFDTFNGKTVHHKIDIVIAKERLEKLRKHLIKKHNVTDVMFYKTSELTKSVKYHFTMGRSKSTGNEVKKIAVSQLIQ